MKTFSTNRNNIYKEVVHQYYVRQVKGRNTFLILEAVMWHNGTFVVNAPSPIFWAKQCAYVDKASNQLRYRRGMKCLNQDDLRIIMSSWQVLKDKTAATVAKMMQERGIQVVPGKMPDPDKRTMDDIVGTLTKAVMNGKKDEMVDIDI